MALSNLIWWPWFGIGTAAPAAAEYHPVGKPTPGLLTDGPPIRRSRRRRLEDILDEEDDLIAVLLESL